jgi:hypothetical protein
MIGWALAARRYPLLRGHPRGPVAAQVLARGCALGKSVGARARPDRWGDPAGSAMQALGQRQDASP